MYHQQKQQRKMMYKGLKLHTTSSFVENTLNHINEERSGTQLGLYSRWHKVNASVGKYFRYGRIYLIAGRSGSCKSYILNMLRNDFLDTKDVTFNVDIDSFYVNEIPQTLGHNWVFYKDANLMVKDHVAMRYGINRNANRKPVILHFGYEMNPEDELIRALSNVLGKSHGYLTSSDTDAEGLSIVLSDSEYNSLKEVADTFLNRKEYYVTRAGTIDQMRETIDYVAAVNTDNGLVITIDHSLLVEGNDDASIVNDVAKLALYARQEHNAMVIILHQFNNEIEDDERIRLLTGHYPRKKDIFFVNKLWFACDTVITVHRPELLTIKMYGNDKLHTENLLHWQILKGRFSGSQNSHVWLNADLSHGRIYERDRNFFRKSL